MTEPTRIQFRISTISLLTAVVALVISLFLLTARHNAQLAEMTERHNAQLAVLTQQHNMRLAEMTALHNAQLAERASGATVQELRKSEAP